MPNWRRARAPATKQAVDLTLAVFVLVYAGMILGGIPGMRIDRTGVALLGAIALVAFGAIGTEEAWRSVDVPTVGLLAGLMVVSAQFRLGGFYARITRLLAMRPTSSQRLLLELMLTAGGLSALLTNDVVCLAVAPVLVDVCRRRGLDPVPFLLGLAAASNVGSAATLIGNPKNMLIGQQLQLSFRAYLLDGAPVAFAGLFVAWLILCRAYRGMWERTTEGPVHAETAFDRWQTLKGLVVLTLLTVGLVATSVPREVLAVGAGGILLLSRRMATRSMLGLVDWQLCVLFGGLFVVNHALTAAGHTAAGIAWLQQQGVDLTHAPSLFAVTALGSNVISNVPLVMLLLQPAGEAHAGALLALTSTLSGNLLLVGSIANLIVVEQAALLGVAPRQHSWVREHMRTGIPITLATLALAAGWLAVRASFA